MAWGGRLYPKSPTLSLNAKSASEWDEKRDSINNLISAWRPLSTVANTASKTSSITFLTVGDSLDCSSHVTDGLVEDGCLLLKTCPPGLNHRSLHTFEL